MDTPYVADDSVPRNTLTRRQALTAATAAPIIPTTAIADPHQAWLEERRAICQLYEDLPEECAENDLLFDEIWRLADLITDTPALTPAGMHAKLSLVREQTFGFYPDSPIDERSARPILTQLDEFLEALS